MPDFVRQDVLYRHDQKLFLSKYGNHEALSQLILDLSHAQGS